MKRTQAATNREIPVSRSIPYSSHVSPHVVTTFGQDLVTVFRVAGVSHQSADVEDLDAWHDRLNGLLMTMQSPKFAIYTHLWRHRQRQYPAGEYEPGSFADGLNGRYRRRMEKETLMVNELFVTIVFSPDGHKAQKLFKIFEKLSAEDAREKFEDALEELEEVARLVESGLREYRPTRLSWYESDGIMYSELEEFFGLVVNGMWERMPVPRLRPGQDTSIAELLPTVRPFFGREAFELRGPSSSIVGAIVALKEYPPVTASGFINKLQSLPFEILLTQSFRFIPKQPALRLLTTQQNKMIQSGDVAQSQIDDIDQALDDLASSRFCMGEHHLSLTLYADNVKTLNEQVALARTNLSDCGAVAVREDWGLEAAYWAQLPGNFRHRTRPAPITSRNFVGFSSLHNYASGLADGNQWGPAATLLSTESGTPYYFNFHLPPKGRRRGKAALEESDASPDDRVAGNTLILGPTGSGKTVIQTFLLAQMEKYRPTVFYYDKDRGMEVFIRAVGGTYLTIENGRPTGFNPFKLGKTADNVSFLQTFVRRLVLSDGRPLTTQEEAEIDAGIAGVLELPVDQRRLQRLQDFLDVSDPEGAAARLGRWIAGGSLSWVFDNSEDMIDPSKYRVNGFDITELLDNDQVREPVLMYLMHRQEEVIDGRRVVIGFDEGWKILYDKSLSAYLLNKEKTIRKQNGIVIFGSQSPTDVIKASIASTLIEQSVTQILLPNTRASHADYVDGLKLTEREFQIIKEELPAKPGHYFLVKQGSQSAVCELDLSGFDDDLAVLSGTTASVELLNRILPETGPDPAAWLPVFHERRRFL